MTSDGRRKKTQPNLISYLIYLLSPIDIIGQFEKYTKVIGKFLYAKPQKFVSLIWITLHLSSWNCQGEEK